MATNQQVEQKKRAEKQMAAAAEHRAKVRCPTIPALVMSQFR